MPTFAKILVGSGLLLIGAGLFFALGSRVFPGDIPGDFVFKRGNTSFYLPVVSSILLSILATVVLNVLIRLLR